MKYHYPPGMPSKAPSDKDIIMTLGGPTAVASGIGYSLDAVKQWSSRGLIPWRFRRKVKRLAAQQKKPLPIDFLDERREAA